MSSAARIAGKTGLDAGGAVAVGGDSWRASISIVAGIVDTIVGLAGDTSVDVGAVARPAHHAHKAATAASSMPA